MQRLIQAQIDQGLEGTRNKDLDRHVSVIPVDWSIHDGEDHVVTRDDLRGMFYSSGPSSKKHFDFGAY